MPRLCFFDLFFFQTSHDINIGIYKALHISDVFVSEVLLTKLQKNGFD